MPLKIYKKEEQATGQFNGGAILENKPIGFPQDHGILKPYSNILYWAHAWTPGEESLIAEHPHQGFEILSFVIKGSIKHYDTKLRQWQDLNEGDVQIIRAGSGISHAELVNANSAFFQIWFDPNLNISLNEAASYDNYHNSRFDVDESNGVKVKYYTGKSSSLEMSSNGVEIYEIVIENSSYSLPLDRSKTRSFYVLNGDLIANSVDLRQHDFGCFQDEEILQMASRNKVRVFVIDLLKDPGYHTYAQQNGLREKG